MTLFTLSDTLRSMVEQYGFEEVDKSLREIGISERRPECAKQDLKSKKRRAVPRVTAPEYVGKMTLPPEKEALVADLANNFHAKSFMPTFGDIADFCQTYGVTEPASKSRANAIPRVFKFIAGMETNELQRILTDGLFSGPTRLGPIADAIRRNGRASRLPVHNSGE